MPPCALAIAAAAVYLEETVSAESSNKCWASTVRRSGLMCGLAAMAAMLPGCHHVEQGTMEHVYVVSKQAWLRDRVAAVSNKVAAVTNGEKLDVLEHSRRFLRVRTPDGKQGWLEDHAVIDEAAYDGFSALRKDHQKDAVVATGVLRDEVYAHLSPGRDSERFLLLPEGDKLQLLERASVRKLTPEETLRQQQKKAAEARAAAAADRLAALTEKGKGPTPKGPIEIGKPPAPPPAPDAAFVPTAVTVDPNAPPPQFEDWWLVRDAQGQVGWLLARRLDVDVPEEVVRYAEGQKIVGAYLLAKIPDSESPFPGQASPEYVMVLNAFVDGMPYDYSRVRVLVWNARKHRYEGGLRLNGLVGYLPVTIGHEVLDPKEPAVPTFTLKLAAAGAAPALNESTGRLVPVPTVSIKYRLDGETVRRVADPGAAMPSLASSASTEEQKRKAERVARHHRRR